MSAITGFLIGKVFRLVLVLVVLIILALVATLTVPSMHNMALNEIKSYTPALTTLTQSCNNYCYTMQEQEEINLITGGPILERERGRDYMNALNLPDYFSCNYKILELVTHALELARWEMKRPVVYISGIEREKNFKVSNYAAAATVTTSNTLSNLIEALTATNIFDYDFTGTEIGNYRCRFYKIGDKIEMVCPSDYCTTNNFNINIPYIPGYSIPEINNELNTRYAICEKEGNCEQTGCALSSNTLKTNYCTNVSNKCREFMDYLNTIDCKWLKDQCKGEVYPLFGYFALKTTDNDVTHSASHYDWCLDHGGTNCDAQANAFKAVISGADCPGVERRCEAHKALIKNKLLSCTALTNDCNTIDTKNGLDVHTPVNFRYYLSARREWATDEVYNDVCPKQEGLTQDECNTLTYTYDIILPEIPEGSIIAEAEYGAGKCASKIYRVKDGAELIDCKLFCGVDGVDFNCGEDGLQCFDAGNGIKCITPECTDYLNNNLLTCGFDRMCEINITDQCTYSFGAEGNCNLKTRYCSQIRENCDKFTNYMENLNCEWLANQCTPTTYTDFKYYFTSANRNSNTNPAQASTHYDWCMDNELNNCRAQIYAFNIALAGSTSCSDVESKCIQAKNTIKNNLITCSALQNDCNYVDVNDEGIDIHTPANFWYYLTEEREDTEVQVYDDACINSGKTETECNTILASYNAIIPEPDDATRNAECSGAGLKITCKNENNEDEDCVAVYAPKDCALICGNNELNNEKMGYAAYDVTNRNIFVSPRSSIEFKEIYGYQVLRAYHATYVEIDFVKLLLGNLMEALSSVKLNNFYSVIVRPLDYLLLPRGKVTELQEGLEKHSLFKGFGTVEHYYTGAVTNPYYLENATKFLYDCLSGRECDNAMMHNLKEFCKKDFFLSEYGYINCRDDRTLAQKIPTYTYTYRSGKDIEKGFYCNKLSTYDACNNKPIEYDANCQPAWATISTGQGRCEDFAIADYTVYKTLGVPETKRTSSNEELGVSLKMGYCTMPCPCKKLAEKCGLKYTQETCAAPQYVTVNPFGTYNACDPSRIKDYPTINNAYLNGSIYNLNIGDKKFQVIQNFTGEPNYYPVYLHKNFDEENDYYTFDTGFNTGKYSITQNKISNDELCDAYAEDDTATLINECAEYTTNKQAFINAAGGKCL